MSAVGPLRVPCRKLTHQPGKLTQAVVDVGKLRLVPLTELLLTGKVTVQRPVLLVVHLPATFNLLLELLDRGLMHLPCFPLFRRKSMHRPFVHLTRTSLLCELPHDGVTMLTPRSLVLLQLLSQASHVLDEALLQRTQMAADSMLMLCADLPLCCKTVLYPCLVGLTCLSLVVEVRVELCGALAMRVGDVLAMLLQALGELFLQGSKAVLELAPQQEERAPQLLGAISCVLTD
mmetsp:Transcript_116181/g.339813  ORF Transcript_116181/g.339813 Transcript_116181/m.339813 type:complete len:233 (+) Transcript_116181:2172-2870(+)